MAEHYANAGLKNCGNTCYLGSIIQLVISNPSVVDAVRNAVSANSDVMARRFVELLNVAWEQTAEGQVVDPQVFVDALHQTSWTQHPWNAVSGQQQCAVEFLQFLLQNIPGLADRFAFSERTLPAHAWVPGSTMINVDLVPVAKVPLAALIHCQYAGSDSANRVELNHLNDVLVVHVKRWRRDGITRGTTKDNTEFSISEPLELFDQAGHCIGVYRLTGYAEHQGRSPHSGHYTCVAKRPMADGGSAWLLFDDAKDKRPYIERQEPQILQQGGRTASVLFFKRTAFGGHHISDELAAEVQKVKDELKKESEQAAWNNADNDLLAKASQLVHDSGVDVPRMRSMLGDVAVENGIIAFFIENLVGEFGCSAQTARRAIETAMANPTTFALTTASGGAPQGQLVLRHHQPPVNDLPMWSDRVNWKINSDIPERELVYNLVYEIIVKHEIYRDLFSVVLKDDTITIFIQRPEQSGKTLTCILLAWLSNLCYGQCAYVLLRSGSQASEDYGKYDEKVDDLNVMIWQTMLGITYDGRGGPYTRLPDNQPGGRLDKRSYADRLCKNEFPSDPAMEGFMQPFLLHHYNLRKDKTLASSDAQRVLNNKWPLAFSRLCTATNMRGAVGKEMATMISAYGVDEHGFANMTLLNDEYQQNVKEGTRVQEEMHEPLSHKMGLFHNLVEAVQDEKARAQVNMSTEDAVTDVEGRFSAWEGVKGLDENSRYERSAFSACIKSQVRISATTISGQVTSEGLDMRTPVTIELKVPENYCGHETSLGMDQKNKLRVDWRGSSNLEFIESGDYPGLGDPPRLQKFVMDEVFSDLARPGYAHILLQSLGVNNSELFDIARFLIAYANQMMDGPDPDATPVPVIAITAYMYTTAGYHPGGPWLVFSESALPLRALIADIAEEIFVDLDPHSRRPVPSGVYMFKNASTIAQGIRANIQSNVRSRDAHGDFSNALHLPKHGALFLPKVLALVDRAIERLNFDKSQVKILTVGANLLKVGMTVKTPDHKMSVTTGLLSASQKKVENLTGEDVSQGLAGRTSGVVDDASDPYWAMRGDDLPPKLVVSGDFKDMLTTYKKVQQLTIEAARQRAPGESLQSSMFNLDYSGMSNLPLGTNLFKARAPKSRARSEDANETTVKAVRGGATTGTDGWNVTRKLGFMWNGAETQARLNKFEDLKEDYPELFETNHPPLEMPMWGKTIWVKWDPAFPHYEAVVIDIEHNAVQNHLEYMVRFDKDEDGKLVDKPHVMTFIPDRDMTEWSYEQPATPPVPALQGPASPL